MADVIKDVLMGKLFGTSGSSSGGGSSGGGGSSSGGEYVTGQFTLVEDATSEYSVQTDVSSLGITSVNQANILVLDTTELISDNYAGLALAALIRRSTAGTAASAKLGYDTSQRKAGCTTSGLAYVSGYVLKVDFASSNVYKGLAGHTYTYWIWRAA